MDPPDLKNFNNGTQRYAFVAPRDSIVIRGRNSWLSTPLGRFLHEPYRRSTKLFRTVFAFVLISIAITAGAYFTVRWLGNVDDHAHLEPQYAIQFALWIAGGIGGVVALVVAYRKQRDAEGLVFVERFGAAAAQLGNEQPAIRMAGVYAMANAADEGMPIQQQQCVDVLCGYLRLPFEADYDRSGVAQRIEKTEQRDHLFTEVTYRYRLHETEVRATVIRVLRDHFRPGGSKISWAACDLDLTGTLLQSVDFSNCRFLGKVIFDHATFAGPADFTGSSFLGMASFDGAQFCEDADFSHAVIADGFERLEKEAHFRRRLMKDSVPFPFWS